MSVLIDIMNGLAKGREQYEEVLQKSADKMRAERVPLEYTEKHIFDDSADPSELVLGDNLEYMCRLINSGYSGTFQLLYLDPPFFTKAKYNASVSVRDTSGASHPIHHLAYDDRFERNLEYYAENLTARLLAMRELLSDSGLLWIHLDWHSAHYVRLILDEIMGEKRFVNEIIWSYKSGGSSKRHFSRKHDTILVYGKTSDYRIHIPEEKSYNRGFKPYHFRGVKEYRDERGWYTLVNMKDVWSIDMVGRTSGERTGYATQKPLELMKRIVAAGSEEGDLVGDFFCGSGSLLEAAELSGRRWIGCDSEELAVSMAKKRLDIIESNYMYRTGDSEALREGRIRIEQNSCDELENGKKLFSWAIREFTPELDIGYIQMSDRKYVEEALRNDTFQFVDYVMIDTDFNGTFSCEITVCEGWDNIQFLSRGNAAIIIVDVFGKEYFAQPQSR